MHSICSSFDFRWCVPNNISCGQAKAAQGHDDQVECFEIRFMKQLTVYIFVPCHVTALFLSPLKTSENLCFSDVFKRSRKGAVV